MARVYQDRGRSLRAGKLVWVIDYVDPSGRRHRERTTAKTKVQAEAILHRNLGEIAKARVAGVQSMESLKPVTFADFVRDEYLPHSEVTKRPSTHTRNQQLARTLLPFFGSTLVSAISAGDMKRYIDRRLRSTTRTGNPPRPATVNKEREFVSAVLTEARYRGYVERNPIRDVKKLPEDNARDRTLSREEEARLLDASAEWLATMIQMGVLTGMRRGEVLSMKWADVDRKSGYIRVPHAKNHKTRYVPISKKLQAVLDAIRPFEGDEGLSPYVSVNPETGKPYRPTSIGHAFQAATQRARLEGVTFHTLRHTFVSRMVQAGVPDRKIMKIVGHSSPHMVGRYAHLAPDDLRDIVDVIDGVPRRRAARHGSR